MTFFPSLSLPRFEDSWKVSLLVPGASLHEFVLVGESGGIVRGKNQVFAGHKRQSVHHEGNNTIIQYNTYLIDRSP